MTTKTKTKTKAKRPQGRQEIIDAVLAAATALIAERGPAAVSLRDVAEAADVTFSQIFRHIGSKDQLLAAVLAAEVQTTADEPTPPPDFEAFLAQLFQPGTPSLRAKLQARIILDGYDLPALQQRYPGIELGIGLLREDLPEHEARFRSGVIAAFFAGWQLLGDTYMQITGAGDLDAEDITAMMRPLLHALATAPSGGE